MAKRFERLLDKATDSTLLEPHWDAILDCVDAIRSAEVPVKTAMQSVRKRIHNENPHVAHHALLVLEACVKNCGEKVHTEIATKEVMEDIKHLAAETKADKVKEKILELVQCWSHAFKSKPEYKIVADTHNLMKLEGFEFPSLRESEAMFVAESAPDWADGDECFRCRTQFGLLTRKHHCRACGQIFCDKCSSRQMILPRYGIEKSVRVCETCFDKPQQQQPKGAEKEKTATGGGESSKPTLTADQKAAKERELKQREEEELQLVMALSQSEAEEKERQRQLMMYKMYNGPDQSAEMPINAGQNNRASGASSGPVSNGYKGTAPASARQRDASPPPAKQENVDPELARYLNRNYWEQRRVDQKAGVVTRQSPTPSAPPPSESSSGMTNGNGPSADHRSPVATAADSSAPRQMQQNTSGSASPTNVVTDDTEQFSAELKKQVEILENRIRSNQARGRSIVNDSSIQSLFVSLTEQHAQVLARMQNLDDRRSYFESLQDRLANIQEARQAITALREDHERRRQEAMLEEQRRRQSQMQEKLGIMRVKKHEMLVQQRTMALQRFQQQEAELQMRKQQAAMAAAGQPVGYQPQPVSMYAQSPHQQFGMVHGGAGGGHHGHHHAAGYVSTQYQYIDPVTGQPTPFRPPPLPMPMAGHQPQHAFDLQANAHAMIQQQQQYQPAVPSQAPNASVYQPGQPQMQQSQSSMYQPPAPQQHQQYIPASQPNGATIPNPPPPQYSAYQPHLADPNAMAYANQQAGYAPSSYHQQPAPPAYEQHPPPPAAESNVGLLISFD